MTLNRISTGVTGLDEILSGGLIARQAYLVKGQPGSGKTTLGFHFLDAGISQGETSLFVSFNESEARLRRNAKLIGIDIDRVTFLDLSPTSDFFTEDRSYDIFSPAEVEKAPIAEKIIDTIDRIKPQRIFLDAITQFRFLTADTFQFRKQMQSFLRFMLDRDITLLFTSEGSERHPDGITVILVNEIHTVAGSEFSVTEVGLSYLADNLIFLRYLELEGQLRKAIGVLKKRVSDFERTLREFTITKYGIKVGEPLTKLRGILSGVPEWIDKNK